MFELVPREGFNLIEEMPVLKKSAKKLVPDCQENYIKDSVMCYYCYTYFITTEN